MKYLLSRKQDLEKARFLSLVLVLLIQLCCFNQAQAKTINIEQVNYKRKVLSLKHDSFADIKFKKRIYDNPSRMVFDLLDSKIQSKETIRHSIDSNDLTEVRVAQFENDTVRIVIEGKSITALEKIRIENIGQTLYFKFDIQNVKIQDFNFSDGNLRITADGPLMPRSIKLDNPDRLVLDLIGSELKSKTQSKTIGNGDAEIIRIAQFDDSIVRVVFTGKYSHKREVRISDNERQILVLGKDSKSSDFNDKLLKSIKLIKDDEKETVYIIEASKKLEYKFLKLHGPDRLVIDLIDTEFDDALGSEPMKETAHVSNVRFGLATLGRPVTRIVFDQKSGKLIEEFKESNGGKELLIRMIGKVSPVDAIPPASKSLGTKVVLDAGHGGYDYGAIYGGYNEKDLVLSITQKVESYLKDAGISAYLTRTEDRFISLAERVEVSNAINPEIFVSIHENALATNPNMSGLQTYYYSDAGYKLANYTHKQMLKDVGMSDGKIRKANFWVCKYTRAPSILVETGFMTNVDERKKLAKDGYQNDIAKSIAKGIIEYLEANKK
jgi:N-acetylmuramoyl-L-alanine amidase